MRERCEVCEHFRPHVELEGDRRTVLVSYDTRSVRLCIWHARIAARNGVSTFEELRELYGEGRRSFVPRRAPRPSPEAADRPRNPGRRASDGAGPPR